MKDNLYDVLIIGGGPAGLAAGIYTSRSRLKSALLEKGIVGGQIVNSDLVENYPGFPRGVSGYDLTKQMQEQARKFQLEFITDEVTSLHIAGEVKVLKGNEGEYRTRSLIIANGSERMKLDVPGEAKYTGRGVSFCATCDAAFFGGQAVAVVGGGNAALTEALHLTKFASSVTVIHRRDQLRATKVVQERALAEPKIKFLFDSAVTRIEGDDFVRKIRVRNLKTARETWLDVAGVFEAVGFRPNTGFLKPALALDELGAVMVNDRLETSIPGVFAAGDIRHNSGRQVITAAGDGALAAINAERYLADKGLI